MELEKIAESNFKNWAEALKTKDPKIMSGFYSEDATFLPTLSPDFKQGEAEAEGYFVHFLEKNPVASIKNQAVQELGDDAYLHSGMYDFEIGKDGEKQMVEARFSYVWKKDANGKWKIIHHHSSLKPQ
jgi:uncharacterized protein (TIGR02246 family)